MSRKLIIKQPGAGSNLQQMLREIGINGNATMGRITAYEANEATKAVSPNNASTIAERIRNLEKALSQKRKPSEIEAALNEAFLDTSREVRAKAAVLAMQNRKELFGESGEILKLALLVEKDPEVATLMLKAYEHVTLVDIEKNPERVPQDALYEGAMAMLHDVESFQARFGGNNAAGLKSFQTALIDAAVNSFYPNTRNNFGGLDEVAGIAEEIANRNPLSHNDEFLVRQCARLLGLVEVPDGDKSYAEQVDRKETSHRIGLLRNLAGHKNENIAKSATAAIENLGRPLLYESDRANRLVRQAGELADGIIKSI